MYSNIYIYIYTYTYISVPRINHSLTIENYDLFWEILLETIHEASQDAIHIIRIPKDLLEHTKSAISQYH